MRFDSAMRSEIPISLICFTASMKRVTTTGASPSNGSSRSRMPGESVMARPMATIFFWPPERNRPRRWVKVSDLGEEREHALVDAGARGRRPAGAGRAPRQRLADLEVLGHREVGEDPCVLGRVADAGEGAAMGGEPRDVPPLERDGCRSGWEGGP